MFDSEGWNNYGKYYYNKLIINANVDNHDSVGVSWFFPMVAESELLAMNVPQVQSTNGWVLTKAPLRQSWNIQEILCYTTPPSKLPPPQKRHGWLGLTRWVVTQRFVIFIPTWGNDPLWLIVFSQMGWNHQLEMVEVWLLCNSSPSLYAVLCCSSDQEFSPTSLFRAWQHDDDKQQKRWGQQQKSEKTRKNNNNNNNNCKSRSEATTTTTAYKNKNKIP